MGGNAILYQGRIFIKDGLDNDMTAKKRILAFEIGTFFTRYVVFEDGRMGIPGTIATPVDGEEPFYQALAHIVSKQRAPLDGIAISVPGFIDTEKQVAVTAGALSILYGHEIGRKLQGYLDDPIPTWMENDANCAAMAEKLSGNAVKLDDFALITIDSGVGGALFLDGRIRRGKDWRAGEQGRLIIYENQPGDFWGLKNALENCRAESKSTGSTNPGFSLKGLSYTTIAIAAINVIVYLILEILGDTQDPFYIASHGGMYPEFIQINHQWWRIFTAMFIHFGLPHLVNNMVIFCCVGSRLERAAGHFKMFVIYMLSGIGGGLLSYFMMLYSGDYAVSAGASGAVFGTIGGLIWVVIRHRGRFKGLTVKGMILMAVLSLYYGFSTIGIDNWCHVGGILTGFLAAMILYHKKVENC